MSKEIFGNQYLYSEDLLRNKQYQTATVEIAEVIEPGKLKSADGKSVDKYVLRFAGKDKMLVLCKTNASIIHHIVGDPPGPAWVGQKITLQVRMVDSFGAKVTAIRVIPPKGCLIRKKILERLGTKAEWSGAANG